MFKTVSENYQPRKVIVFSKEKKGHTFVGICVYDEDGEHLSTNFFDGEMELTDIIEKINDLTVVL